MVLPPGCFARSKTLAQGITRVSARHCCSIRSLGQPCSFPGVVYLSRAMHHAKRCRRGTTIAKILWHRFRPFGRPRLGKPRGDPSALVSVVFVDARSSLSLSLSHALAAHTPRRFSSGDDGTAIDGIDRHRRCTIFKLLLLFYFSFAFSSTVCIRVRVCVRVHLCVYVFACVYARARVCVYPNFLKAVASNSHRPSRVVRPTDTTARNR